MMKNNQKILIIGLVSSVLLHFLSLFPRFNINFDLTLKRFLTAQKPNPMKVRLRKLGEKGGVKDKLNFTHHKKPEFRPQLKDLGLNLRSQLPEIAKNNKKRPSTQKKKVRLKPLELNKKTVRTLLSDKQPSSSIDNMLHMLKKAESFVQLEVPEGVKLDELNEKELVYYSFQKRTALTYINSLYKKLTEFNYKNPHMRFPMTNENQKMTGRVVYDKDGHIVRINMIRWSQVEPLQNFFLSVLKEMTSLPNPPKDLLKQEEFTVFFSLIINT